MNDVTLVTITCSRDQFIQELQSCSIDKFVKDPCEHVIIIEDDKISYDEWHTMLSPYYTRHKLILLKTLLGEGTYINDSVTKNGWHRSAILKLLVANSVSTSRYLVLDSKNFFVNPVVLDQWPCDEGNHLVEQLHVNNKLSNGQSWPNLFQYVKEHSITLPNNTYSTTTPFMVKTRLVQELLNIGDVPALFLNNTGWSSELFLYSVYTQHVGNKLIAGPTVNLTFWNTERTADYATLTDIASWPGLLSLGLHRDFMIKNSDLTELYTFLESRGFNRLLVEQCLTQYRKDVYEQRR